MSADRDLFVILVGAGDGARLDGALRKAAVAVAGRPLITWSLAAVARAPSLRGGVVVVHPDDLDTARDQWLPVALDDPALEESAMWTVTAGGATRRESVLAGLAACPADARLVLIHDGARPLLAADDLARVVARGRATGAAILGSPVSDTLKRVGDELITEEVERGNLFWAETPQVFDRELLERAHREWGDRVAVTDDAGLVERVGAAVAVVETRHPNPKVTFPRDLDLVEAYIHSYPSGA